MHKRPPLLPAGGYERGASPSCHRPTGTKKVDATPCRETTRSVPERVQGSICQLTTLVRTLTLSHLCKAALARPGFCRPAASEKTDCLDSDPRHPPSSRESGGPSGRSDHPLAQVPAAAQICGSSGGAALLTPKRQDRHQGWSILSTFNVTAATTPERCHTHSLSLPPSSSSSSFPPRRRPPHLLGGQPRDARKMYVTASRPRKGR